MWTGKYFLPWNVLKKTGRFLHLLRTLHVKDVNQNSIQAKCFCWYSSLLIKSDSLYWLTNTHGLSYAIFSANGQFYSDLHYSTKKVSLCRTLPLPPHRPLNFEQFPPVDFPSCISSRIKICLGSSVLKSWKNQLFFCPLVLRLRSTTYCFQKFLPTWHFLTFQKYVYLVVFFTPTASSFSCTSLYTSQFPRLRV